MNNLKNAETSTQKFISVCIIGKPNSGKSTLLNQILGQKISIVTPKVQTTRSIINGITIIGDTQIMFFDTPGIFEATKQFDKAMVKCAWSALNNADIVLMLIDVSVKKLDETTSRILTRLKKTDVEPVYAFNKIDLVKDNKLYKDDILNYLTTDNFNKKGVKTFDISAIKGTGLKKLLKYICSQAKNLPWPYAEDEITTLPMRFLASEITREQLFLNLHEELPYKLTVFTEKWEELKDKSVKIYQTVLVQKAGYKAMILGASGKKIKEISLKSRLEIEKTLNIKVHLFLFVKVHKDWENNLNMLSL